jgi:hypothetical protein
VDLIYTVVIGLVPLDFISVAVVVFMHCRLYLMCGWKIVDIVDANLVLRLPVFSTFYFPGFSGWISTLCYMRLNRFSASPSLAPYVAGVTLFLTGCGRCGVQVPAYKSQRSVGLILESIDPCPLQPRVLAFISIVRDHFSVRPAYLCAGSAEDLAFPACGELLEPVL